MQLKLGQLVQHKRLYGELGYQPPLEIAEEYWDKYKLSDHAA
jgi:hypothetical protein